jgi:hypothetical protein
MARRNKTISPPFVMIEKRELLQSVAFKKLKGSAFKLYVVLRAKTLGHINQAIHSEINLSYTTMTRDTGLSRQTVRNALIELDTLGFIDLTQQGGLRSGGYSTNRYKLSLRFYKYNLSDFKKGTLKKGKNVDYSGFGKAWKKKKQNTRIENRPRI